MASCETRSTAQPEETANTAAISPTSTATNNAPTAAPAPAKRKRTGILTKTKHQATKAIHKTEEVVETSIFCCPLKFVLHFPKNWPRITSLTFGVLLPLWCLIFLALGCGLLLVQYESQPEIDGNDAILAARARQIAYLDYRQVIIIDNQTRAESTLLQDVDDTILMATGYSNGTAARNDTRRDGSNLMEVEIEVNNTSSFAEAAMAFDSLSFNWNRCWDEDDFGNDFVFMPTDLMINATQPEAQEDQFIKAWKEDQESLYQQYLEIILATMNNTNHTNDDDNSSSIIRQQVNAEQVNAALLRSIEEATGGETCFYNLGGTAWFFFTIMTTVGYGNQAPITEGGRWLVAAAGIASLILFGVVLGLAGHVILSIFDDFVSRFCFAAFLSHPGVGVLLWGSIWAVYAMTIAVDVEWWWKQRWPEFYHGLERSDAVWFAYISTSTIGLGDFYLQPELLFFGDALRYSLLFMVGFVLLSTFLNKVAETMKWILPSEQNSLETRLKHTRILFCWKRGLLQRTVACLCGLCRSLEDEKIDPVADDEKLDPEEYASTEDKALVERIERLRQMMVLPADSEEKEKTSHDDNNDDDGDDAAGNNAFANQSSNLDLIHEQEAILRSLLAMALAQKERAQPTAIDQSALDFEPEENPLELEPKSIVVSCQSLLEGVVVR